MAPQQCFILMAEDDLDDRMLLQEAMLANKLCNPLTFVENGEELLEYLTATGIYENVVCKKPSIVLLDLNMPKVDGREALRRIKSNPDLCGIPIIVFTTSSSQIDIIETYNLGVNSFISKPVNFKDLVVVVKQITDYWFGTVKLPEPA